MHMSKESYAYGDGQQQHIVLDPKVDHPRLSKPTTVAVETTNIVKKKHHTPHTTSTYTTIYEEKSTTGFQTLVRSLRLRSAPSPSPAANGTISWRSPPSPPSPRGPPVRRGDRHPRLLTPSERAPLLALEPALLLKLLPRLLREKKRRDTPQAGMARAKHTTYRNVARRVGPLKSSSAVPPSREKAAVDNTTAVTSAPWRGECFWGVARERTGQFFFFFFYGSLVFSFFLTTQ